MRYKERNELIESLREFADYLENDHRAMELPMPYKIYVQQYVYEYAKDESGTTNYSKVDEFETRVKMRKMAKALAPCEKNYNSNSFELKRMFGTKLLFSVSTTRDAICEKKVIGTKVVPAHTIPERVEEEVEWVCNDSLLRPETSTT